MWARKAILALGWTMWGSTFACRRSSTDVCLALPVTQLLVWRAVAAPRVVAGRGVTSTPPPDQAAREDRHGILSAVYGRGVLDGGIQ